MTLHQAEVPVISDEICNNEAHYNGDINSPLQICAGYDDGITDSCKVSSKQMNESIDFACIIMFTAWTMLANAQQISDIFYRNIRFFLPTSIYLFLSVTTPI